MIIDRFLADLTELIAIPSVAAWGRPEEMTRAADWLVARLDRAGLKSGILPGPAGSPPYVYAQGPQHPARPTLLIYGHYDVQPADQSEGWASDPFTADLREGKIYGRGTADQKMNLLLPIYAIEALCQDIQCNVKFFIEGEEEILSPHLAPALALYREKLQADVVISSDGWQAGPDLGDLRLGLRGFCGLELTICGAPKDLHSGTFGGVAPNPALALSCILAHLSEEIAPVPPPSTEECRRAMEDFDLKSWKAISGLSTLPEDAPILAGLVPALEIHALEAGNFEAGLRTIVPQKARARVSRRLVQGQCPDLALKELINAVEKNFQKMPLSKGLSLAYNELPGRARPYRLRPDHPAQLACFEALKRCDGRAPKMSYSGGSIPLPGEILRQIGLDTVIFGFALPDENIHGVNEFCRITDIMRGFEAWKILLNQPPQRSI